MIVLDEKGGGSDFASVNASMTEEFNETHQNTKTMLKPRLEQDTNSMISNHQGVVNEYTSITIGLDPTSRLNPQTLKSNGLANRGDHIGDSRLSMPLNPNRVIVKRKGLRRNYSSQHRVES